MAAAKRLADLGAKQAKKQRTQQQAGQFKESVASDAAAKPRDAAAAGLAATLGQAPVSTQQPANLESQAGWCEGKGGKQSRYNTWP